MRSMASGAAFHRAYHRATQQAFLEAHEHAFQYFQGVFAVLRYDNLKSAVKKILRGYRREETERFIAFRSHWHFQSEFTLALRSTRKGSGFILHLLAHVRCPTGMLRLPSARAKQQSDARLQRCVRCSFDRELE
jgi:hypothetical protein